MLDLYQCFCKDCFCVYLRFLSIAYHFKSMNIHLVQDKKKLKARMIAGSMVGWGCECQIDGCEEGDVCEGLWF